MNDVEMNMVNADHGQLLTDAVFTFFTVHGLDSVIDVLARACVTCTGAAVSSYREGDDFMIGDLPDNVFLITDLMAFIGRLYERNAIYWARKVSIGGCDNCPLINGKGRVETTKTEQP